MLFLRIKIMVCKTNIHIPSTTQPSPKDTANYRVEASSNMQGHSTWSNSNYQILLLEISRNCLYQQFLSIEKRTQHSLNLVPF